MKRLIMSILAIFFPWLVLFIYDNPGGGIIALIMQATIIGWIPASVWAWRVIRETEPAKKQQTEAKAQTKKND